MLPSAFVSPLRALLDALTRWDQAAHALERHRHPHVVLSPMQRAAMRRDVASLHPSLAGTITDSRTSFGDRLRRWFSSSEARAALVHYKREERAVLRHYEGLCERALPFTAAALLLRHHDTMKRATRDAWAGPVVWRPRRHLTPTAATSRAS